MVARKTGLGRGLEALLGEAGEAPARRGPDSTKSLPVDLLVRGAYQPRHNMHAESLEDLARSIRSQGIIQPIVVRPLPERGPSGEPRYEIVAGERRWRAAQIAGLQSVPVVVRDIPDSAAIAVALIENIQRENLNPLEEAQGIRRLIDEFGLTHEQAADAIGRSRVAVSNLLRLLQLGEEARGLIDAGSLEMGHGRALLALTEPRMQAEVAALVAKKGLSVRETEQLVRRMLAPKDRAKETSKGSRDPDVRRLEQDLAEKLGARVAIQQGKGGGGKLVVSYGSLDELDGILSHIS
jgi:ParB family chromosome partitioning protein